MLPSEYKRLKREELGKPTVHKKISNSFIENALTNKTIGAIKITYYLSTVLKDFDYTKDLNTVTIDTSKMLKYTELTMPDIRNNLKKMQQTSITFIDENQELEEIIPLVAKIGFYYGRNRKVEIDIYSKIAKLIVDVTKRYSFINTKELMRLKSIHSIRLLPILEMIHQFKEPAIKQKTYTLEDLNSIFDTKYKRYNHLEIYILKKAKEELDNNSSLTFDYEMKFETLGKGRASITGVILKPKTKGNYQSTIFSNLEYPPEDNHIEKDMTDKQKDLVEAPTQDTRITKIESWYPNLKQLDLGVEFGIAQQKDENIKEDFNLYLEEQIEVFKKYCVDEKKDYKNMDTSFKRHIRGAYKNSLDFFS